MTVWGYTKKKESSKRNFGGLIQIMNLHFSSTFSILLVKDPLKKCEPKSVWPTLRPVLFGGIHFGHRHPALEFGRQFFPHRRQALAVPAVWGIKLHEPGVLVAISYGGKVAWEQNQTSSEQKDGPRHQTCPYPKTVGTEDQVLTISRLLQDDYRFSPGCVKVLSVRTCTQLSGVSSPRDSLPEFHFEHSFLQSEA